MKVAVISCYDQIDYVRARTLRTAFAACPDVEMRVIKNKRKGLLRYLEVPLKIIAARFKHRPDVYVITFRGYEMLPLVLLIKGRKPLVFDEFVNAAEYLQEHGKLRPGSTTGRLFIGWYGSLLRRCRFILTDTQAHAEYSAALCRVPIARYRALPVNADETLFYPRLEIRPATPFTVLYYGNGMTPLHGLSFVLDAAVILKDNPNILFSLIGGRERGERACAEAVRKGARITYETWVPFEEIPLRAASAGLTLGGPFGKTLQSQFVITGKTYQFLACQAPVLVARNKVTGLFKDKVNCLMVPQGDTKAIAKAIAWAADHPKELAAIAASGHRLYKTHFSQAVINDHIVKLVQEL